MPGGVVKPIPGQSERAIKRMVPNADWPALRWVAEHYQLESEHTAEAPAAVRGSLTNIVESAVFLKRDLQMLGEESRNAIGDWGLIHSTVNQLSLLIHAAKVGHNETEPRSGRPGSLRKSFVRNVAAIIGRAGYAADSTPNGPLVAVVSELLSVYGNQPADVPAMVRSAMRENPIETA